MDFKLDIKPVEVIKRNHRVQSYGRVQQYIDSECIRRMAPYTPFLGGALEKAATLGTKIGSGTINQTTPYARYQYYGKVMVSSVTGSAWASQGESKVLTDRNLSYNTANHPQAGKMWFERMKTDHRKTILKGAQRLANRGV